MKKHLKGMELIEQACRELNIEGNGLNASINHFIEFGGVDAQELTPDDISLGIEDRDEANWSELWWACSEMAGGFALEDHATWTSLTTISAFICVVVMSNGLRRGHGDVDFEFDRICEIVVACGRFYLPTHFPVKNRMGLMQYALNHILDA